MQNVNLIVALQSRLSVCYSVIALTLWSMDVKIKALLHYCLTYIGICKNIDLCIFALLLIISKDARAQC